MPRSSAMEALDKEYPNERTEDDEFPPEVCNFRKADATMPGAGWSDAAWTEYPGGAKVTVLGCARLFKSEYGDLMCDTAKWIACDDCDGEPTGFWQSRVRDTDYFNVDFPI